ncbi:MAG: hypothetical protein KAI43_00335 [Candidatus Aureabacteria bacterium]|nr:hypothetical protein [Candidatus Auribacterota bacterium]
MKKQNKYNVLIINSDETTLKELETFFVNENCCVNNYENSIKALNHLENNQCNIIIIDIIASEHEIHNIWNALKNLPRKTKIILLIGKYSYKAFDLCFSHRVYPHVYLYKPLNSQKLKKVFNAIQKDNLTHFAAMKDRSYFRLCKSG